MNSDQKFLENILAFLERHNLTPTQFGVLAVGDPNFVSSVQNGRSVTLRLHDRVIDFMAKYKRGKNTKNTRHPSVGAEK